MSSVAMFNEVKNHDKSGRPIKENAISRVKFTTAINDDLVKDLKIKAVKMGISTADLIDGILTDHVSGRNISNQIAQNYQISTTTDYSLFRPIDGNRVKNLLHINRLKKSISKNYLFTVITVNEKFEIIDGQHRFDAIKDLKLPLHYIMIQGYGLDEVHILNQLSKTWNADDYLTGYCNLGYEDYLIYADFKEKYQIGHNETQSLLSGFLNKCHIDIFYSGNFKVKSLEDAENTIEKILMIEPYYSNVRRRAFVYTMISLLKNPNFEFTEFLQKLKLQPTALMDCGSMQQYKVLIEEIYNYRRREKVNLRF
jgi:hypothetical protein